MQRKIALFLWLVSGLAEAKAQGKLPPIGQRKYVLDAADRFAPVAIEKSDQSPRGTYLKDPVQPGHAAKPMPLPAPKPQVAKKKPTGPKEIAGQLRFKSMPVGGHLQQPRVEFTRDVLPLGRADEPLTQDFYQKVFEPARDETF